MIIDITGIRLVPGNGGRDCPGNGEHQGIERACDECDYALCCLEDRSDSCPDCRDLSCPHSPCCRLFWQELADWFKRRAARKRLGL